MFLVIVTRQFYGLFLELPVYDTCNLTVNDTPDENFLYKTTADKWSIQHFSLKMTHELVNSFSTLCEILTSDWLDDAIEYVASYVTIKYRENKHDWGFTQIKWNHVFNVSFYAFIRFKNFLLEYLCDV